MRIGLIAVDGKKFPNFALMKIAAYHKSKGDFVDWYSIYDEFDIVYMSKIFTFTPDYQYPINAKIIKGGTGYDTTSKLPEKIEICDPDYSIYPDCDFSIHFFSRGCIRNCPFCLVSQKEGKINPNTSYPKLNPKGTHIEVLDNNFFANPFWTSAVEFLKSTNQYINLHGVDVRIISKEQCMALNSMKLKGNSIHIAWDSPKENIIPKVELMLNYVKKYKIMCYVLIGYWSTKQQDYERVMKLEKLGISAFVMPYRDYANARKLSQYEKDFASWVNKKERFNSCDFLDFEPRKGFRCRQYFEST
jgi:hypothetical protein